MPASKRAPDGTKPPRPVIKRKGVKKPKPKPRVLTAAELAKRDAANLARRNARHPVDGSHYEWMIEQLQCGEYLSRLTVEPFGRGQQTPDALMATLVIVMLHPLFNCTSRLNQRGKMVLV